VGSSRSPALAALLSLLLPGLGQAYAGRPRRALVFLIPAVLAWAVVLGAVFAGWRQVFGVLVQPGVLPVLLVAQLALFVLHVVAVVDAWSVARRRPRREAVLRTGGGGAAVAVLLASLAAAVVLHGLPGLYTYNLAVLLPRFAGGGPPGGLPTPSWLLSPSPSLTDEPTAGPTSPPTLPPTPTAPPTPTPSPSPTPFDGPEWLEDGRLDLLLLGSDAGPGRFSARPDAVLLVSVDVESGRVALFGFPRYMNNIPMPPEAAHMFKDGRYPGYLNAFYVAALNNPRRFPFNDEAGWGLMTGIVQELSGADIDGYMLVDFQGFERMVDALGGVWIDVPPSGLVDGAYSLGGRRVISMRLSSGCQHLDGRRTLFFARTRHQDSDIHRLERQLVTLQSIRRSYDPLEVLPRVPEILDAAGDAFVTSFSPEDLPVLADVAAGVDFEHVERIVFAAPEYPRNLRDDTVERIHAKVRGIFDEPLPEADLGECPTD
jgi:polyisoprenyl-teichoic acid--peptidoglycan teichoic acid transferase